MSKGNGKAVVTAKLWEIVKYQIGATNCGNCEFADKTWVGVNKFRGKCNLVKGMSFPVVKNGICMHHSAFGKNSIFFVGDGS